MGGGLFVLDPGALRLPGAACASALARCPWAVRFQQAPPGYQLLDVIQTAEQASLGNCTFQALPLGWGVGGGRRTSFQNTLTPY